MKFVDNLALSYRFPTFTKSKFSYSNAKRSPPCPNGSSIQMLRDHLHAEMALHTVHMLRDHLHTVMAQHIVQYMLRDHLQMAQHTIQMHIPLGHYC